MDVITQNSHSCVTELMQNEMAIAMNDVRHVAQSTDRPLPQIYDDALNNWQQKGYDLVTSLPRFENAKHSFYDSRNKSAGVSKINFKSLEEVQIPVQHLQYVVADYYDGHTKIVVFCMEEDRAFINDIKEIFGDATFNCTPSPFAELFIIHGEFGSTNITTNVKPILYALLSDKSSETYVTLFNLLKSQFPDWQPQKYHCDFELAALNAIQNVFPGITVVGCYFHWSQAMWRNGKKICGQRKTKSEKRLIGLCSVLPLLPNECLQSGWDYIQLQYNSTDSLKIKKFLRYVKNQWLSRDVYSILSVFANRHRTNNVCESWHSKINKNLNKKTNILRLLNVLKKLTNFKNNTRVKSRSSIALDNDNFIQNIQMELTSNHITVGYALEKLR